MDTHRFSNLGFLFFSVFLLLVGMVFLLREIRKARNATLGFKDPRILASILGLLWGLTVRLVFAIPAAQPVFALMSVGFLFICPFTLGYFSICTIPREQELTKANIVFLPWLPTGTAMFVGGLLGFEGAICLIMACPLWLFMASLGGILGAYIRKRRVGDLRSITLLVLMLPFGTSAVESLLPSPLKIYRTENMLEMRCNPEQVWKEIRSVAPIKSEELHYSLSQLMGFPAPVEAKLIGEGVGSIREATFVGGVTFTETVTEWEPLQALAFGIRADTERIPRTTLDEHVTIGGEHFDMLSGRYEINPLESGIVRLKLSSEHRLSTKFNLYASLWSTAIMSSIQKNILRVIRARCEETQTTSDNQNNMAP